MKPIFLIFFTISCISAYSQSWQSLGADNKNEAGYDYNNSRMITRNDSIYVALSDANKACIRKYDGSGWNDVTSPLFATTGNPVLALDTGAVPYALYIDNSVPSGSGYAASVKKYVNGAWSLVGNAGFTGVQTSISYLSIKFDHLNTPFVLFFDANNGKPTVMKFNGTSWVNVGSPAFTPGTAGEAILDFDNSGVPYVAYTDWPNLQRAVVVRISGGSWTTVGSNPSALGCSKLSMGFSTSNEVYLGYLDQAAGNRATVMNFNGTVWSSVGASGFSGGSASSGKLFVNSQNELYFAMDTTALRRSIITYKFDGTNWVVTAPPLTANALNDFKVIHDSIPVIASLPDEHGGKLVVRSFRNGSWSKLGEYGFAPRGGADIVLAEKNAEQLAAFADSAVNGRVSVMKYSSGGWSYVGQPGFSNKTSTVPLRMKTGNGDTIYVTAFYQNKLFLNMFDGSQWMRLDSSITSSDYAFDLDTLKIPYIAYAGNLGRAEVKSFKNGAWQSVGSVASNNQASNFFLKIGKDNTPFLSYYSFSNSYVTAYSNGSWQVVGPTISEPLEGFDLDTNDIPHVVYSVFVPSSAGGCLSCRSEAVFKLNGSSWTAVGSQYGVTPITSVNPLYWHLSFCITKNNTIVLSYTRSVMTTMYAWNGSNWSVISSAAFSWPTGMETGTKIDIISGDSTFIYAGYISQSLFTFSFGNMYVYGFDIDSKPAPPIVTSPVIYCQFDTAVALTAIGNNLQWSNATGPLSSAPIPSTLLPGKTTYYVSQASNLWTSAKDSIEVIVHAAPTPTISFNGQYFQSSGPYATYQWYYNGAIVNGASADTLASNAPGYYYVLVTDTNGCKGVSATYDNCSLDTSISMVNSTTLQANQANATYQWLDCNTNTPISGATNQSYQATSNGNYAVIITLGSCKDTSSCINVTLAGVPETAVTFFKLYPNPNNGIFTLETNEPGQVMVLDAMGREIYQNTLLLGANNVNLSSQPSGVYTISITTPSVQKKIKVVLNK